MRKIAFILFHTGDTTGLLPTLLKMTSKPEKYTICIIPVGQAAKSRLPEGLQPFVKIPSFISSGESRNDDFHTEFPPEYIQEILDLCEGFDNVVIGHPAKIQVQIAQALSPSKRRIIYFDAGN